VVPGQVRPESIELCVDWLLPASYEVEDARQIEPILELARLVVEQDGVACELNQRGLHSNRHESGVLVPQEYELWHFHQSIRSKLDNLPGLLARLSKARAAEADQLVEELRQAEGLTQQA
jgi:hypothetical protein